MADLTCRTRPRTPGVPWTVTGPGQADVQGREWPSPGPSGFCLEVSTTQQNSFEPIPVDLSVEMLPLGELAELIIFEGTSGAQGNQLSLFLVAMP